MSLSTVAFALAWAPNNYSTFSPIPKHVMDGSEPGESVAAAVLSGAPVELQARTVRYLKPRVRSNCSH